MCRRRRAPNFREQGFKPGEYVLVEVADTGTGMTPEVMEKIFEPFFTTKGVGEGTGLGLSTVYGIVKQTGGYIYVDSKPGEGSTFRILLPRHDRRARREGGGGEARCRRGLRSDRQRQDTAGGGRGGGACVRRPRAEARGYTVFEAASGPEALELMKRMEAGVDLVISDVVMPGMDGPTLAARAPPPPAGLKIIFMSGYAEDAFQRHLPGRGDFQFLPKPFSLKELATTVKETLEA